MTPRESFGSQLCRAARDLGIVEAGAAYELRQERVVHRKVCRKTNGLTRKFLKGFGL
jgi:hypothetical protein